VTYPTDDQVVAANAVYADNFISNQNDRMRAALIAAEQEAWLPIESAPKDGTRIMLYRKGHVVFGHWNYDRFARNPRPYWSHDDQRAFGTTDARKTAPTHWRPLPAVPGAQA